MNAKNFVIMVVVLTAAISGAGTLAGRLSAQTAAPVMKIGTYDSRIVILAYSRSELFKKKMQEMGKETEAMLGSKDSAKMKEGALKMISFSYHLEKSVFTSASATSTINLVKDQFPALAKAAGVSMIVSKWDLNYSDPGIEIIDVTQQIAALFDKEGTSKNTAAEIGSRDPLTEEDYGMGESIDMWEQFKAKYGLK